MMVAFEFWRIFYDALLTDPKQILRLQDDNQREGVVTALLGELELKVEESRRVRRLRMGDQVFFGEGTEDAQAAAAPYFLGYCFVRRLFAQWRQTAPDFPADQLFGAARTAISTLLPMTLLLAELQAEEAGGDEGGFEEPAIQNAIGSLLTLSKWQIGQVSSRKLIALDLNGHELTDASGTDDFDADVLNWVLAGLFPNLTPAKRAETKQLLWTAERSKFVQRLEEGPALLGAVNEKHRLALLFAAAQRVAPDRVGISRATWFPFAQDRFDEFLKQYDAAPASLSRIDLQEAPIRMHMPAQVVPGTLATYCIFHPFGAIDADDPDSLPTPMVLAQRFTPGSPPGSQPFDSGMVSLPDLPLYIAWQAVNASFVSNVKRVLDPSLAHYRETVVSVRELYLRLLAASALVKGVGRAWTAATRGEGGDEPEDADGFDSSAEQIITACESAIAEASPDWHSAMQARCRAFYAGLLFPFCREGEAVAREKFEYLGRFPAPGDLNKLRVWLLYGAVLSGERAYRLAGEDPVEVEAAVGRIRRICLEKLGAPLVAFDTATATVALDLLPPPTVGATRESM
jgi:hypothetical protein